LWLTVPLQCGGVEVKRFLHEMDVGARRYETNAVPVHSPPHSDDHDWSTQLLCRSDLQEQFVCAVGFPALVSLTGAMLEVITPASMASERHESGLKQHESGLKRHESAFKRGGSALKRRSSSGRRPPRYPSRIPKRRKSPRSSRSERTRGRAAVLEGHRGPRGSVDKLHCGSASGG
jgi:hypothetical protein